jgi:hypothetical protein
MNVIRFRHEVRVGRLVTVGPVEHRQQIDADRASCLRRLANQTVELAQLGDAEVLHDLGSHKGIVAGVDVVPKAHPNSCGFAIT